MLQKLMLCPKKFIITVNYENMNHNLQKNRLNTMAIGD